MNGYVLQSDQLILTSGNINLPLNRVQSTSGVTTTNRFEPLNKLSEGDEAKQEIFLNIYLIFT